MKKFCKIALVIFTLFSVYIFNMFGQTSPESDFEVVLTDDGTGAVITGYNGNGGNVIIPDTIQGFPVKEIGDLAFNGKWGTNFGYYNNKLIIQTPHSITNVIIPDSVEKIGAYAFVGGNFQNIKLPASLKRIGYSAFKSCAMLQNLEFPDSLEILENGAFSDCHSLQTVKFPKSLKTIGDYTFWQCKSLKSVELYDFVEKIVKKAFSLCHSLQTVKLSNSLKIINDRAFFNCGIISIEIPDSVEEIGVGAFENTNLITLKLPQPPVEIHGGAFRNSEIKELTIMGGAVFFGDYYEDGYETRRYDKICYYTFYDCNNLESIVVGTMKNMPSEFVSSKSLKNIIFKSPDTVVKNDTFNCPNLTLSTQVEIRKHIQQ